MVLLRSSALCCGRHRSHGFGRARNTALPVLLSLLGIGRTLVAASFDQEDIGKHRHRHLDASVRFEGAYLSMQLPSGGNSSPILNLTLMLGRTPLNVGDGCDAQRDWT